MPGTGKIALEDGDYQWDSGKYQPPSSGGGLPPGWFSAPHEEAGAPAEQWRPAPMPQQPSPPPPVEQMAALPSDRQSAREFLGRREAPTSRVNLDSNTAAYMGYEFPLTEDSVASIKMILAMEVCLILELEKERILGTMQQQGVQESSAGSGADVPEVQGTTPAVESPQTGGTGEVQ
jgi:hypothetical protein